MDGGLLAGITNIVTFTVSAIAQFSLWFYTEFLPFIIQYFGIPLFILGVLMALAFTGGTLFFVIIFCVFMYYFIKGTIFHNPF